MQQTPIRSPFSLKPWQAKLKGAFMLFRVLAVLVWAFNAGLISNAAAAADGFAIDFVVLAFVLLIAAVVQGYPAHIVNEIYDWQSGADRAGIAAASSNFRQKKVSGGSKVIAAGLLTIADLWRLFFLTTGVVVMLAVFVAIFGSWRLLFFLVPGFLFCLFYSMPPLRFAYRPFLGEFLGGFAGIVLLVSGGYYAQSQTLTAAVIILAVSLGFLYAAIMVFFHYIDYTTDRLANPPKRTTVVFLGLEGSRVYACLCAGAGTVLMLFLAVRHHAIYTVLLLQGLMILYCHWRVQPDDGSSLVYWGKIMTYFILLTGLIFATAIEPRFAAMLPVYLLGFWAHKRFGKLQPQTYTAAATA